MGLRASTFFATKQREIGRVAAGIAPLLPPALRPSFPRYSERPPWGEFARNGTARGLGDSSPKLATS